MKRIHAAPGNRAFTLVELVISAALMSVILVSAYACLRAGLSGRSLMESRTDASQSARVAMERMTADLRGATPLSSDFDFVGMHREIGGEPADNLDFATHNYSPQSAREGDFCEVSYFLNEDPETGLLHLYRRRDPTPDPEPLSGGNREEIVRGVRGLKFEYYDGFEWFEEWGDTEGIAEFQDPLYIDSNLVGMPEAVRITLMLEPSADKPQTAEPREENRGKEPPLVFQTVVHLNLATHYFNTSSGTATSDGEASSGTGGGE